MTSASPTGSLESSLAELLMSALTPCDLGEGNIEVLHEVEAVEIEMDCALEDDDEPDAADTLLEHPAFEEPPQVATTQFIRVSEDVGTHQFVRESAPYERIQLELDAGAFRRATINEAKRLTRHRAREV